MPKVKLTDTYVRSLEPAPDRRLEFGDQVRPGLWLRVAPTGRKTWVFEKRVKGGKKRKHALGEYPNTSIREARTRALEIQIEAEQGIDRIEVNAQKKRHATIQQQTMTPVGEVLSNYKVLHLDNLRTGREVHRCLKAALEESLDLSSKALTQEILQGAIDAKANSGAKIQANRLKAYLSHFCKFGRTRGYFGAGVGLELQKAVKERAREREPSLDEVRAIWGATFEMGKFFGPAFRLLILTVQRRGEIADLRWSEIDFDGSCIVLGGIKTKNANSHITHLSQPALDELRGLLALKSPESDRVFTSTGTTPISGFSKAKARLDKLLGDGFEPWRLHDIRTGFATLMANLGESEGVVDRILNHDASGSKPSAVARVYNRAKMLPERRRVLDRWARLVIGAEESAGKVIQIG